MISTTTVCVHGYDYTLVVLHYCRSHSHFHVRFVAEFPFIAFPQCTHVHAYSHLNGRQHHWRHVYCVCLVT